MYLGLPRKPRLLWDEGLHYTMQAISIIASVSKLTCFYSTFILHNEVIVTEDKINALIKTDGVNVEPFRPGLLSKALANVNIGSFISDIEALDPAPAESSVPVLSHHCVPSSGKENRSKEGRIQGV